MNRQPLPAPEDEAPPPSQQELLQKQKDTMVKQDQALDDLGESVRRLKEISLAINSELDTQNRILDELNENVDKTQSRIGTANKQVKKIKRDISKTTCSLM